MFRCPDMVQNTLRGTAKNNIQKDGILATRLCTHKEDVDQINVYQLEKLTGRHFKHLFLVLLCLWTNGSRSTESRRLFPSFYLGNKYCFVIAGGGRVFMATDSDSNYGKQIDAMCPVPERLELRLGAQVIVILCVEAIS